MEQLEGGAKKIFDEMDYEDIKRDAVSAWKTMNLSANEYLDSINTVGANFASTLGDKKGYETAKEGLQAISDFASGTGKNVLELNQKYQMITRSTSVYQSIADQFAGILPGTSKEFLAQAQAAGFLSNQYKNLTEVPMPEYQEALTKMLSKGTQQLGLTGNTAAETAETITGSIAGLKASFDNFLNGSGGINDVVYNFKNAVNNIMNAASELIPKIIDSITQALPELAQTGSQMINSLIEGLANTLPTLISSVITIVATIAKTILEKLPLILDCGFKVIIELIKGITKELPSLLKMAPDIIKQLVEVLTNNLPELLDVAFELIQVLIEGLDEYITLGMEYAPTIIEKIVNALMEALPKLMPVAVSIITTLIDVMTQNLPLIIECSYTLIIALAEGIIRNLPQILSAGGQIVWALINGIIQLIGNVGQVGLKIANKIKEKIDGLASQMGSLAGNVIRQFIQGIINWLGNVGQAGQDIVNNIRDKIINLAWQAWDWGSDLVRGFANGIRDSFWRATSAASNLASQVRSFLHFSRPDRGPLRDYEKWMPDMVEGLARSLKQASPLLERQASALATKLQNAVAYESSVLGNSLASNGVLQIQRNAEVTATLNSIDNDKEITVNAITNLDSKVLTQAVNKVNARQKLAYGLS